MKKYHPKVTHQAKSPPLMQNISPLANNFGQKTGNTGIKKNKFSDRNVEKTYK